MVFRSAVDWWFYAVVIGAAVVTVSALVPVFTTGRAGAIALSVLAVAASFGLVLWMMLATYYRVDGETLSVRSGPFHWTIPLAQIRSVKPSRSPLSSPALSLDRIEITYGADRSLMVSPKDRQGFLAAIGHPDALAPSGRR